VSYTVFARKYRPQKFDDVLGQEHITRTLRNAIEQNRIAHAYIFVGPRGTGKTSTARIFAMALNCTGGPKADFDPKDEICQEIAQGRSLDVIEIDGASNNGVEQVRELRENVRFMPARGKFKIYIIDEVHMLSTAAFNALLKTLEEPPAHAKFMMATTDVQKVLPTILSRCQRFDLRRIPTATIARHLLWIAEQEKFTLAPAAAEAVARGAEGGLRDAESMLDQLVAFCGNTIAEQDVLSIFGFTAWQSVSELCGALIAGDAPAALGAVQAHAEAGKDLGRLMSDLIAHLRNLLVIKANPEGLGEDVMPETVAALEAQAADVTTDKLLDLIEQFAAAEGRMKWAANKKMHFEVAVIRAIQALQSATLTEVLDTLTALRGGQAPPPAPKVAPSSVRPSAKAAAPAPAPPAVATPKPKAEAPKVEAPKNVAPAMVEKPVAEKPVEAPPVARIAEPEPKPAKETAAPAVVAQAASEPAPAAPVPAEFWRLFLEVVRRDRKLISAWVESGALLGIEGSVVTIGFPPSQGFAKDFLEQGHLDFLAERAGEILGRKMRVRLESREGLVVAPPPPPPAPKDPMEEFKDDPLIRKALEIFKAEIQAV
jgi:DNA polymerase-3 subunit gamma/tau